MAQYDAHLTADFDRLLQHIEKSVVSGSVSASREGGSSFQTDGVRCATRIYERYSYLGGNRLTLSVTLFGKGKDLHLTAVTSGGSQGVFLKFNTFGEDAFLKKFIQALENFPG